MEGCLFFLVGNIPSSFRSANLRNHFSHFVEGERFRCFHYRHRPEELNLNNLKSQDPIAPDGAVASTSISSSSSSSSGRPRSTTHCCVVAVEGLFGKPFVDKYHSKNWSQLDGGLLPGKVRINRLNVTTAKEESNRLNVTTSKEESNMTSRSGACGMMLQRCRHGQGIEH